MKVGSRIVIVGATSAIAEHCARLWLEQGARELVLLGRDEARLSRVARDLRVRAPEAQIETQTADLLNADSIAATVDALAEGGAIDGALIAHGTLPEQSRCQADPATAEEALAVNGVSPVLWAGALAEVMEKQGQGVLALLGSVAGDRGRRSNYVYGAAKALVDRYAEGLQHRFAGSGVLVVLVKPGPTDTPMTAHLRDGKLALAPVESVADAIVRGIEKRRPVIYAPAKWRLIMLVLRHLPQVVFNRLDI